MCCKLLVLSLLSSLVVLPSGTTSANHCRAALLFRCNMLLLKLAAHAPYFNASVILLARGQIESGGVLEYEPIMSVYLRHLQ